MSLIGNKKSTTNQTINDYTTTKNTGISGDGNSTLTDSVFSDNRSSSYIDSSSTTLINNTLDGGAFAANADATRAVISANESIASTAIDSAIYAASGVVDVGEALGIEALRQGGDFVAGAARLATDYGGLVASTNADVIGFAANSNADAYGFAGDAITGSNDLARDFGGALGDAWAGANSAILDASQDAMSAYDSANQSIQNLAASSTSQISRAYDLSNQSVTNAARDSIEGYQRLFELSQKSIIDTNVYSQNANNKALDYVFNSTKDATERNTETYIKYATYAAIGIAGAMALSMFAGRR